jgi:hypothetical protein
MRNRNLEKILEVDCGRMQDETMAAFVSIYLLAHHSS